ncbi:hypothetical protein ACFL0V_02015 [Nanoarchaeota archaeon]
MKEKIKNWLLDELAKWIHKVIISFQKDSLQKLFIILISPFLIYAFSELLVDFSIFAMIGYCVACIYGLSKILDDPYRIIKWGAGYAIGASVTPLVFSLVWPELKQGTSMGIFTSAIMLYVLFMILWRARELKKS